MSLTPPAVPKRLRYLLDQLDALVDWERRDRGAPGAAMRVDVEPTRDLCRRLSDPQRTFQAVHVAGTKGKGSVAALIASGLGMAGRGPVGLYGSPHVERVHERIRIDLESVGDAALAGALEVGLAARAEAARAGSAGADASWFDVLTAASFASFRSAGCAWAVIECGLGGRLDSTNVLDAGLVVLTNIDLEHTAILGSTRAEIAAEKAGIIASSRNPPATVISGVGPHESEEAAVVRSIAADRGARLIDVPAAREGTISSRNLALARAALAELGAADALDKPGAIEAARLPGRRERFQAGSLGLVLDGAHVASSLTLLLDELASDPTLPGRPTVVLGLGQEKDADSILKVLAGRVDRLILTRVGEGPYRDPEELRARAAAMGIAAEVASSPGDAFTRVLDSTLTDRWCLVTGSLHLVGAIRPLARGAHDSTC